jgi:hypothetical protein
MTLVPTLAGIGWTPEIRGILSVLVGVVVLMGSVYLLLATNVAHRLGFLLALTAVFGWMTIHGLVWWIYPPGTGPAGRGPSWEVEEIVYGELSASMLDEAHGIDTSTLPPPDDVDELTPEEVEALSDEQHADDLDGWTLLAASDASRGEAQTALDAVLAEGAVPGLEDPSSRVYTYTFETGGKPARESDGVIDRITNRISNTLRVKHPPHYAIVQLQPSIPQETVPGEAPPAPEADDGSQVISAVLVRDIGERRLPAALIFTGSGLIFGLLCVMLHQRDRRAVEHRSAPVPATTGG